MIVLGEDIAQVEVVGDSVLVHMKNGDTHEFCFDPNWHHIQHHYYADDDSDV